MATSQNNKYDLDDHEIEWVNHGTPSLLNTFMIAVVMIEFAGIIAILKGWI